MRNGIGGEGPARVVVEEGGEHGDGDGELGGGL